MIILSFAFEKSLKAEFEGLKGFLKTSNMYAGISRCFNAW